MRFHKVWDFTTSFNHFSSSSSSPSHQLIIFVSSLKEGRQDNLKLKEQT
jgi:hypothetical protein